MESAHEHLETLRWRKRANLYRLRLAGAEEDVRLAVGSQALLRQELVEVIEQNELAAAGARSRHDLLEAYVAELRVELQARDTAALTAAEELRSVQVSRPRAVGAHGSKSRPVASLP